MENMESSLKNTIFNEILKNPTEYSFHQTLFLMEIFNQDKEKFGSGKIAENEAAILGAYCNLSAPSSDCIAIKNNDNQYFITLNNKSLIGIDGILPQTITETILSNLKSKNNSLLDFFNILHHRLFGLMHKIEKRTNLSLSTTNEYNKYFVQAISGVTQNDIEHTIFHPFAHVLWNKNRTAHGLKAVIQSIFNIQVEIEQFLGQWIEICEENKTYIGDILQNKILGTKAYCIHQSIKIILHFNSLSDYEATLPNTTRFKMLQRICKYYLQPGFKVKYEFTLAKQCKSACTLSNKQLGYNSWLGTQHNEYGCVIH